MTREEAIKAIQDFIGWFKEDSLIRKALEMAIQALSQVPCDDAISRQSIIDTYTSCADMLSDEELKGADLVMEWVNNAPPVMQKLGKWRRVSIEKYIQHAMAYYVCSECGGQTIGEPKFCPNCGAKMESEDKE